MSDKADLIKTNMPQSNKPAHANTAENMTPRVAKFWKRLLAFIIDAAIMMLAGQLIGMALAKPLSQIGPYAHLLGLLIVLPYYGIMNSRFTKGQTFGKMIMKIVVVSHEREPIGLGRSFLRILILAIPFFLYGLSIPEINHPVFTWAISIIVFGIGGVILYTMAFNMESRQGIHDMLLKTYVVDQQETTNHALPKTSKMVWTISAIWAGLTIAFFLFLSLVNTNPEADEIYNKMSALNAKITAREDVLTSSVTEQTLAVENTNAQQTLIISVWLKGQLSDSDFQTEVVNVAGFTLQNFEGLDRFDAIQIRLLSGYDIGIGGKTSYYTQTETSGEWSDLVAGN